MKKRVKLIPIPVKIISILFLLFGVIQFLTVVFYFSSELLALSGILSMVLGWFLWKGKNWARILIIIMSILGVFDSGMSIFKGENVAIKFIPLLFYSLIGGYLFFNKKVKKAFPS
jgi:uncharacterized membrane protein